MNRVLEQQVLDLARERGLIGEGDVDASAGAEDVIRRWGGRLGVLVTSGAMAEDDVAALVGELTGGMPSADGEPPDEPGDDDEIGGGVSNEARTNVFWHTEGGGGSSPTLDVSGRWSSTTGSVTSSPVPDWERYEIVDFLGAGGMGRVYKAYDPRLQRHVALKFISRNDPEVVERFFREAQSQAQVEHPHVCRIYEVGEVDGQPYIAMQLVEGDAIHEVRDEMTLDERVVALASIADAVHAAHRTGLIHRDIKPSNILVGRAEEGGWDATILDFGLARQMEGEGLTMTGALMGTPSYMAPEQARGEAVKLDRRTDVYGLGGTLYMLLSGQPPYDGTNQLEILLKAAEGEPPSLATLDPTLPTDLCNITTRAMEREPQRRYDSARALADDLRRYLDGEPVEARPQTVGYKLGKWARRNRRMVAVGGVALVTVLVALGLLVHQRVNAAEQQRLAQRFSQEAAQIESVMWKSRAVPAHDTRPEKELVRSRMEQIEADMAELGRNARGPGHQALGTAHLALFESVEAREQLQLAWDAGNESPEVAYGLAVALGDIYQREREAVEALYTKEQRDEKIEEVARQYRDPAVDWLRLAEESERVSPDYASALIAFHEDRYDEALAQASRALEGRPWLYEAWILQGLVYSQQGLQRSLDGDREGAVRAYELGEFAFRAAEQIAPSDVRIQEGLTRLYLRRYTHRLLGDARQEDRPRLLESADLGVEMDAERAALQAVRCNAYETEARWRYGSGEDAQASLDVAVEAGKAAVALTPHGIEGREQLASAYNYQAFLDGMAGTDPRSSLRSAQALLEEALAVHPTYQLHVELGQTLQRVGHYELNHGLDPLPSMDASVQALRHASELRPTASRPRLLLSELLHMQGFALYLQGEDPNALYREALEAATPHKENDPFESWLAVQAGYVHMDRAAYEMSRGQDPSASLAAALEQQALSVPGRPKSAAPMELLGDTLVRRARHELSHGQDPGPTLDEARAAYARAIELRPGVHSAILKQGWPEIVAASHALRTGRDPGTQLDRAAAFFDEAIAGSPGLAGQYAYPAEGHAIRARAAMDRGRSPVSAIDAGRAAAELALVANPTHADVLRVRADLEISQARWRVASGGDPSSAFAAAEKALSSIREGNPHDTAALLLQAEVEYRRAAWWEGRGEDGAPARELGEGWVDQALEIKPDLADALALRGRLMLGDARGAEDPAAARQAAGMARDAFEAALVIDANLERSVRGDLAEARRRAR